MVQVGVPKVGWIGTGVMGKHMAGHLLSTGRTLLVYDRTASHADDLVAAGAQFMHPQKIAQNADVVFQMLGYPHDVRKMVLDKRDGIL